ncbi:MAG: dTDP-4-dehydrorhamnose reductase [Bacteroidales bacterium]|jgi:dTDP-4-dehydrorhamnose reductase|nr:dTDP-4-dehydrorhamnose reductase [Bacteroidales bacterium]
MTKVLILGSYGQLGSEINKLVSNNKQYSESANFVFTDADSLDITNYSALSNYLKENKFDYIINCAAYTNVDKAEDNVKQAFLINSTAVKYLSQLSKKYSIRLIHVSTDYVFNGKNPLPYKETDPPNPNSVYGKCKLKGEEEITKLNTGIIIRTSWLYSTFGNNFAKTIIKFAKEKEKLKVVFDQIGTPTYAEDLAAVILKIVLESIKDESKFKTGIYHYSNEGVCSWYDFAHEIINKSNISCNITAVESKEFPTKAVRPANSVLNKEKIKNTFNISIPHWKDSLYKMMDEL